MANPNIHIQPVVNKIIQYKEKATDTPIFDKVTLKDEIKVLFFYSIFSKFKNLIKSN
jgi:hypothetical protein